MDRCRHLCVCVRSLCFMHVVCVVTRSTFCEARTVLHPRAYARARVSVRAPVCLCINRIRERTRAHVAAGEHVSPHYSKFAAVKLSRCGRVAAGKWSSSIPHFSSNSANSVLPQFASRTSFSDDVRREPRNICFRQDR